MRSQLESLRALAYEALRVVAAHDATKPWRDTGRWESLCRGCGHRCDRGRRWCPSCCEVLP